MRRSWPSRTPGPSPRQGTSVTLQSAIDGILAEIATLGGATNLVNAPAWLGNVTWDLLAGTNQIRNLHATGPLSIQLANDDWTLSFGCDAYTTQQTDDAIAAALTNYFTRAEVTATIVAAPGGDGGAGGRGDEASGHVSGLPR